MIKVMGDSKVLQVMKWLNLKKFKYNMDVMKTDAIHGVYFLDMKNKQEELLTRIAWGLI